MSSLGSLLDLADLAVARCEGVLSDESREELADTVRRARRKRGFIGETLVVAFAGGTGSGKSSLVNGIVGESVAPIGVVRPTTDAALAVTPMRSPVNLDCLLSDLGVTERVESGALESSVLVDLPDFDSTVEGHRRIVEDVLPRVDAVVWVFDPEKYSDRTMHDRYLSEFTAYESQFLFVLNHADRLGDLVDVVSEDLARLLIDDGFAAPEVVSTTARAPNVDVSRLISALSVRLDTKRTVTTRLVTDLRIAANRGWADAQASMHANADDSSKAERSAISSATFVSLGVEAISVLHDLMEG